jgi:phytanoyl-CoA dioxygenase PhyH
MSTLDEQGFEVLPDCLSHAEVRALARTLDASTIHRSRAGMRKALQVDAVRELANDPRLLRLAVSSLGGNAIPFHATLFDKSLHANWLVVWHQDTALPLRERRDLPGWGPWSFKEGVVCAHAPASALEQVLAIRVHLDDSNAENGPLRVLPGTHALGVLTDDSIHELVTQIEPAECHSPAGGLLLMRPLVVHASSKATSDQPRRVLHIEYAATSCFAGGVELAI